jgi:hypothetical protein
MNPQHSDHFNIFGLWPLPSAGFVWKKLGLNLRLVLLIPEEDKAGLILSCRAKPAGRALEDILERALLLALRKDDAPQAEHPPQI